MRLRCSPISKWLNSYLRSHSHVFASPCTPVAAECHHPVSRDRDIEWSRALLVDTWYTQLRVQLNRVAVFCVVTRSIKVESTYCLNCNRTIYAILKRTRETNISRNGKLCKETRVEVWIWSSKYKSGNQVRIKQICSSGYSRLTGITILPIFSMTWTPTEHDVQDKQ